MVETHFKTESSRTECSKKKRNEDHSNVGEDDVEEGEKEGGWCL